MVKLYQVECNMWDTGENTVEHEVTYAVGETEEEAETRVQTHFNKLAPNKYSSFKASEIEIEGYKIKVEKVNHS